VSKADKRAKIVLWDRRRLAQPHAQQDKAWRIRRMFDAIAPRYRLINKLASAGRDEYWRREAVRLARLGRNERVLDVGCGTGDLAAAFAEARPRPDLIVGIDFSHDMLVQAARQIAGVPWCEADALRLPFADQTFTVVSCAFVIRNFQDLQAGLAEMFRVLRRGGRLVILEFRLPENRWWRAVYWAYLSGLMPLAASWLSADRTGAYRYLPRSVLCFPGCAEVARRLRQAGFAHVEVQALTFGIVAAYVGVRP